MRLVLLSILMFTLGLMVTGSQGGDAYHSHTPKPYGFKPYFLNQSVKKIDWRGCAISSFEENTAGVAFNNWVANFAQGTSHQQQADGCSFLSSTELIVYATTDPVLEVHCGGGNMCFNVQSGNYTEQWNAACLCYVRNVARAHIYFDWYWFNNIWDIGKQLHLFAHEFGHGMGLGDFDQNGFTHPCGSSVMSGVNCTDLVHSALPYPNDVCGPDVVFGYGVYGQGRCHP